MIDQHRLRVIRPAMHDAMANAYRANLELAQPGSGDGHGSGNVCHRLGRIRTLCESIAGRPAGAQPRASADPVHLSLDLPPQPVALHPEDLKLHAGGAGVDNKDRVHGTHAAATGARRRLASASSAATAAEAILDRAESARDVNTTGTRAPSTMPAPSALAK